MNTQVLQDPEKYFWLVSGKPIRSLLELFDKLKELTNEEFDYHLNERKNDFHKWIRGVFGEEELADMVEKCTHRDEFRAKVNAYLLDEKRRELTGETVVSQKVAPKITNDTVQPNQVAEEKKEDSGKMRIDEERGDALQKKIERLKHEADEPEEEKIETTSGLPEKIPRITALEAREQELREVLRIRRKLGQDTFMPELILRRMNARMKLAKLTREEKEIDALEGVLEHAEEEMQELLTTKPINVKKEVSSIADIQEAHLPKHSPAVANLLRKINGETDATDEGNELNESESVKNEVSVNDEVSVKNEVSVKSTVKERVET